MERGLKRWGQDIERPVPPSLVARPGRYNAYWEPSPSLSTPGDMGVQVDIPLHIDATTPASGVWCRPMTSSVFNIQASVMRELAPTAEWRDLLRWRMPSFQSAAHTMLAVTHLRHWSIYTPSWILYYLLGVMSVCTIRSIWNHTVILGNTLSNIGWFKVTILSPIYIPFSPLCLSSG